MRATLDTSSLAQGLHHHGPWETWSVICPLCCWERWSWVVDNNPSRSRLLLIWIIKEVWWTVLILVGAIVCRVAFFLSRFGSLLVWVAGCHHDGVTRWPWYLFVTTYRIGIHIGYGWGPIGKCDNTTKTSRPQSGCYFGFLAFLGRAFFFLNSLSGAFFLLKSSVSNFT